MLSISSGMFSKIHVVNKQKCKQCLLYEPLCSFLTDTHMRWSSLNEWLNCVFFCTKLFKKTSIFKPVVPTTTFKMQNLNS